MKQPEVNYAIYLKDDHYDQPKELFKFIAHWASLDIPTASHEAICDVGCATGEFLYYIHKLQPYIELTGMDVSTECLSKAQTKLPHARFIRHSIKNPSKLKGQFDRVFMTGVLSIYDMFFDIFNNLIEMTASDGALYITELFNPYPYDVYVQYKPGATIEPRVTGWNMFSQKSVSAWLSAHPRVKEFEFIKFDIPIDIAPQEESLRSWTVKGEDGERMIVNGLNIMHPLYLLRIQL